MCCLDDADADKEVFVWCVYWDDHVLIDVLPYNKEVLW